MTVAVTVAAYNEEKNIAALINVLAAQTVRPDEIIIVDDGSHDGTVRILQDLATRHPNLKVISQTNSGPAAARNKAWRASKSDICVFTDGDCVPEPNWLENLLKPFTDPKVGAAGGTYKTLNNQSLLARFIGLEISWKYRNITGEIDAHGSYNLAVRRSILEEIGGYDESFRKPSGEDWDLTYKISNKYKMIFVPTAVVGHYHPEDFIWYMRNQSMRAYDRVKLYNVHQNKRSKDVYTPATVKYQILLSGAFVPSLLFLLPVFTSSFSIIPLGIAAIIFLLSLEPFVFYWKRDPAVSFYSVLVQIARNLAWFHGLVLGVIKFGVKI